MTAEESTAKPSQSGIKTMGLKILLPTEVLVDEAVTKIIAEAENGAFCLLPRHVDFVAALAPSVLSFFFVGGRENFVAVDRGVLVKCGDDVSISTFNGVRDEDLDRLQTLVSERYLQLDEHERRARTALARLEAGTLRGFWELQEITRG